MPDLIRDHLYDALWPRDDSQGCAVQVSAPTAYVNGRCGKPLSQHALSEYGDGLEEGIFVPKHAGADGSCPDYGSTLDPCPPGCASGRCVANERPPGDMHEPKPYTGELDWRNDGSELVHPFID